MEAFDNLIKYCYELNCKILKDELLCKYTSFKIGGPADLFIEVKDEKSLSKIIKCINRNKFKYFILGNGSNILVPDEGFRGIIINLTNDFQKIVLNGDCIECGAGVLLSKVCLKALEAGLSGLEFAWGIPGTCGGAVYMNAGAYGSEMSSIVVESKHITIDGNKETLKLEDLNFGYRTSIYASNNNVITSVKLKLTLDYADSIKKRMDNYMFKRKSKQPLEYPSAGSIFKRPKENVFVGPIIEQCGLKGKQIGGAMVSTKHCGFIVNVGNATYKNVLDLIRHIQNEVYIKTNIKLECEVKILK